MHGDFFFFFSFVEQAAILLPSDRKQLINYAYQLKKPEQTWQISYLQQFDWQPEGCCY